MALCRVQSGKNAVGGTIRKLAYVYQDNDLLATITETGVGGASIATTSFTYDSRHRLTYEVRTAEPGHVSYEHGYTYDQGGNRLVKSNVLTTQWTGGPRSETRVSEWGLGGERFEKEYTIAIDEPEQLLGTNTAPNPQEHLLAASNACMLATFVAACAMNGIELDHVEI
jgi:hypothetical protein